MLKAFKTEINPTGAQAAKINRMVGTCRFIYNFYLKENRRAYEAGEPFLTANSFSKWLNNEFLPGHPDYSWIKEVSSKAVKQAMRNGERAYRNFFEGRAGFPEFKKKKNLKDVKAYFPRNHDTDWACERHRVKIPTLGWVRVKEKGYLPMDVLIRSGTVSKHAGRYYVSVLADVPEAEKPELNSGGIGIDLGVKNFAVCSNRMAFPNINKSPEMRKLYKRLDRLNRACSRKYGRAKEEKFKEGKAAYKNLQKDRRKIAKLYVRIARMREDYIDKCVNEIVKTKPSYIALEDLNVKGMMKNKHLSKDISRLGWYMFRSKLINKCGESGITVRIVSRWYPSSKLCSNCGHVHKGLQLKDRTYVCPNCGLIIDRDYQASINLRDCEEYTVIA